MLDAWVVRAYNKSTGEQYLAYAGHEFPTRDGADAEAESCNRLYGDRFIYDVLPAWKGRECIPAKQGA